MYRRVVVAYDGSDRSLAVVAHARRLAEAWGCAVELLHVRTPDQPALPQPDDDAPPLTVVEGADTVDALVDAGSDEGTLLCMTSRGRSAVADRVFGGVARQVLGRLHAPVVVGGPRLSDPAGDKVRRVLVALDGSPTSAAILPVVRRWSVELSLEVVLVHVVYPPSDPVAGPYTLPPETRAFLPELERTAVRLREEGVDAASEVVEDTDPAAGVLRQAAHRMVDLVLLASHGRGGLDRMLMGSTTRAVVRGASVPVLTLRLRRLR